MNTSTAKNRYREFAAQCADLPLFFQPWYLDTVAPPGEWDVALSLDKEGTVQGVFPYYLKRKFGIPHITMPLLTPYLGPFIVYPSEPLKNTSKYRYEKNIMFELASQIPDVFLQKTHCHPDLDQVLPFIWNGYDAQVRYTYVLDRQDENILWEGLDSKQRNIIKGAQEKLKIVASEDIRLFYQLNKKAFARTGERIPYDESFMVNLNDALFQHDSRMLLLALDENGDTYAGIYILFDKKSAYCLCIGSQPELINSGAVPLLIWEGIQRSFERVERFNFEGGMIPNIERIFRSFGGVLTPYFRLQKARNTVIQSLMTLLKKA